MSDVMKMAEISMDIFKKPFHQFIFGRPWDEKDEKKLMEHDVLSISVLLYIFSDAEGREKILAGLEHLFGIEDPEGAILFFLSTKVNAPYEGEKLFRRIGLCTGLFHELANEQTEAGKIAVDMHDIQECLLLAIIQGSDDIKLHAAILILSSFLTCRLSQIRGVGITEPQMDLIKWESFSQLSEIFKSYEIEVDAFVPFEDKKMNEIALPIYESFRAEIEKDGLVSFTERNKDPQRYIPYTSWDYTNAVGQIQQMNRHMEDGDLSDFFLRPSQMTELKQAVGEIFNLGEEANEVIDRAQLAASHLTMRDMVMATLFQFFMYLSASDGFYARKEAQAVEETLGIHYTPGQMDHYVRENNLYSASFDEKEPELLKIFVQLDEGLKQKGLVQEKGFGERLTDGMDKAGGLFLQIDGNMNDDEVRDLGTYISTMRRYLDTQLR